MIKHTQLYPFVAYVQCQELQCKRNDNVSYSGVVIGKVGEVQTKILMTERRIVSIPIRLVNQFNTMQQRSESSTSMQH